MLKQPIPTTTTRPAGAPTRRPLLASPTHRARSSSSSSSSSGARQRAPVVSAAAADDPLPPSAPLALKDWAVTVDALLAGDQVLLLRKGGLLDGTFALEASSFLLFPTTFHVPEAAAGRLLAPGAKEKFAAALALPEPKTLEGSVPLRCRVRVEAAWSTADGRVVEALAGGGGEAAGGEEAAAGGPSCGGGLHVWGPAFTEARLKWRPGAPMTLALVRAYALGGRDDEDDGGGGPSPPPPPPLPLVLPVRQRSDYYGCFSWTRVEPLLGEEEEAGQQQHVWRPVLSDEEFARRAALVRRRMDEAGIDATPLELPA